MANEGKNNKGRKYADNNDYAEEVMEANSKQPAQNNPSEGVNRAK
ncbi:hypothetical protein [Paenibacillus humicola]|nr:hypothetical protein [Paenibacillus humicola]